VVLPVVALVILAIAYGLVRTPTWSAESRVLVGRLDARTASTSGYVQGSAALASTYARLVRSNGVDYPVAQVMHLGLKTVQTSLSASSISGAPIVQIRANTSTQARAISMSQQAAMALVAYAGEFGLNGGTASEVLGAYKTVWIQQLHDQQVVAADQQALDALKAATPTDPTAISKATAALATAQAQVAADKVRLDAFESQYAEIQGGVAYNGATIVQNARLLGSDRRGFLVRSIGIALLLGFVLGVVFATIVENGPAIRFRRAGRRTVTASQPT
jgi:capsular polysaccharide biosynthesis protein